MMKHKSPGILKLLERGVLNVRFADHFNSVREIADYYGISTSSVYIIFDEFAEETGFRRENLLYFQEMAHKGRFFEKGIKQGKREKSSGKNESSINERLNFVDSLLTKNSISDTLQAVDLLKSVAFDLRRM